jgi:hypothetical protein
MEYKDDRNQQGAADLVSVSCLTLAVTESILV